LGILFVVMSVLPENHTLNNISFCSVSVLVHDFDVTLFVCFTIQEL
jgi:hypothetical protein